MEEQDKHILEVFAARVREQFPQARIWAFGSRARGNAHGDSDFDVCVVLEHCHREDKKALRRIAWEVAFEYGPIFNTLIFADEEFRKGPISASTLVQNILNERIPV